MSKLLRSELKSIVKECLLEILSEGIGSDTGQNTVSESRNFNKKAKRKTSSANLDNVAYRQKKEKLPRVEKPKNTALTSDPLLNELLADTARTTLHEQVSADSKRGIANMTNQHADSAARAVSEATPEEMFGNQATSKWQKLAFFDQQS